MLVKRWRRLRYGSRGRSPHPLCPPPGGQCQKSATFVLVLHLVVAIRKVYIAAKHRGFSPVATVNLSFFSERDRPSQCVGSVLCGRGRSRSEKTEVIWRYGHRAKALVVTHI